ncbi:imm11 family protein [Cellvibrio sp. PSBB006]|uniref:imm11 family protein n=1 Tax=Cellvibrio sp. PSBB006 TaxID=1987723 RepID=UPI000B3B194C|nr:DUF1629 domain-containing protein [Cellvibrio sp. PSBB006]ARU26104.1 hypothetical protein CBR65_00895 [Cellvibrio sp. PSBB006]
MTIYKILPDYERYCVFTLPMKDILLALRNKISPTRLMHFYKHNLSLENVWVDISATFESVAGTATTGALPDVTVWIPGTLVFSAHAIEVLPGIENCGELLPVKTLSGRYWILNCMKLVNADEQHSKYITEADQVLDVEVLQFSDEEAKRAGLFKSPFDGCRNVFCSEQWMKAIQHAKLGGLNFSENLAGGLE